jgi:hypothetical protein
VKGISVEASAPQITTKGGVVMNPLRVLALASISALLTGCGTFCQAPGEPGFVNEEPCSYLMKVTKIDKQKNEVTTTISTRAKAEKEDIDFTKEYTFPVRDLDRLATNGQVVEGKEYVFFNATNGPILEAFPKGFDPIK